MPVDVMTNVAFYRKKEAEVHDPAKRENDE
jgi:hypothetical protein